MHAVLAADAGDPAFAPETLDGETLARARARPRRSPRAARRARPGGPAEAVRARGDEVLEYLRALLAGDGGGEAIRQHGDYHLGQVLWAGGDWLVLDFEGEPARPLAERRRKSSPLRDVAGMLRSFAYAAETARARRRRARPAGSTTRARRSWSGYVPAIDPVPAPRCRGERERLLAACELEKALYELGYELDNRPDWVHVPVAGILRLLE